MYYIFSKRAKMYYMPVITLRVSDEQKEAWVELAGGAQKLSAWIRERCDGALGAGLGVPGVGKTATETAAPEPPSPAPSTPRSEQSRVTAKEFQAATQRSSTTRPHMKRGRPAIQCPSREFKDGVCVECGAYG